LFFADMWHSVWREQMGDVPGLNAT
jgi:hypothetical protein